MAYLKDHALRDAHDAARKEISILVSQYVRRISEDAKEIIAKEIESAARDGRPFHGISVGREAATEAAAKYFPGYVEQPSLGASFAAIESA